MIRFTVGKIPLALPESWAEIVPEEFFEFNSWVAENKPETLKEFEDLQDTKAVTLAAYKESRKGDDKAAAKLATEELDKFIQDLDPMEQLTTWPLYYGAELEALAMTDEADPAPCPVGLFGKVDVEDVLRLRNMTMAWLGSYSPNEDRVGFTLAGTTYLFPQKFMRGASLIEFVESVQFEHHYEQLGKDRWEAMIPIICILCRKKGEEYDSKLIDERGPIFRAQLTMDIVIDLAFFLARQKLILSKVSLMLLAAKGKVKEASRAGKQPKTST